MRHALLLAGGQGKRFWPRSRKDRPKQFMAFAGGRSLLRVTAERIAPVVPFERQWVVTHRDYVERVLAELPEIPVAHVIGEPRPLNTAPAVGMAAALMREEDPAAVMLVQAADHWIRDLRRFRQLVAGAFARVEASGSSLLIGFRPTRPATGYGYIRTGRRLSSAPGLRLFEVRAYKEKPSAATARRYLDDGTYLWNGCLFFWTAATVLSAIGRQLPVLSRGLEALARRRRSGVPLAAAMQRLYRRVEPVSIEHGVVEKLADKVVLEGDCGWEDVGSWAALANLLEPDGAGNRVEGLHVGIDTRNALVFADSGLVVTLGVHDLIVVKDGDAVLVLPRALEAEMRQVAAALEKQPRLRRFL